MSSSTGPSAMAVDNAKRPALNNIPIHVFEQIMSNLEPIWIYNMSHVCKYTQDALSYAGGGNRIWYDALPSSVLSEPARYQDPAEQRAMLSPATSAPPSPTGVVTTTGQASASSNNPTTPTGPSGGNNGPVTAGNINQMPITSQGGVVAATAVSSAAIQATTPPGPTNGGGAALLLGAIPRNRALGGPYQPLCNYRREFVGRFQEMIRCNICLRIQNNVFGVRIHKHWGVLWCDACLRRYTIHAFEIHHLVGPNDDLIRWVTALSIGNAREVFLVTEIQGLLRAGGLRSLQYFGNQMSKARHQIKLDLLQMDPLEPFRPLLRQVIVEVAQAIWDGRDVAEVLAARGYTEPVNATDTNPKDPKIFRFFRERWAPTSKLPGFLFPQHLLQNSPTVALYEEETWLPDPSLELFATASQAQDGLTVSQIIHAASVMIDRLVATDYKVYVDQKIGRSVSKWAKAAKAYHGARIRAEVQNGCLLAETPIPPGETRTARYRALHDLRKKLGLQRSNTTVPIPMPQRPATWDAHQMSQEEFIQADMAAIARLQQWNSALKYLNRIFLATVKYCPRTNGVIDPPGLDSLLNHFDQNHTKVFYNTEAFGINH